MKSQIIGWFLVGIIAVGVGFYIYKDISPKPKQEIVQKQEIYLEDDLNLEEGNQNGIEITPVEKKTPIEISIPDLNKPIIFADDISDEVRKTTTEKINKLTEELKKDNNLFSNWIELGLYRKLIKDYEGAKEVWEYTNLVWPKNNISFNNLGDLYHFYLKDFPKAEQNLRTAIENNKQNTGTYTALHELYKYSYKQDTILVTDILFEGLAENPNNIDLLTTLAAYYKETGNTINAKKYYEQARDEAQKLGNIQLVELLNEEISNL